jgi:hypothetical protein
MRLRVSATITAAASVRLKTKYTRASRGRRLSPPCNVTPVLAATRTGNVQAVQGTEPPVRRAAAVRTSEIAAPAKMNQTRRRDGLIELGGNGVALCHCDELQSIHLTSTFSC